MSAPEKDHLVTFDDKPFDEQALAEYASDGWRLVKHWICENGEYCYEFER